MARSFDSGSTQYLSRSSAIITDYPMSVAGWFYPTTTTSDWVFAQCQSIGNGMFWGLNLGGVTYDNKLRALIDTSVSGGEWALSTAAYQLNQWNHGVATFNSATERAIYLDGGNKGTDSVDMTEFPQSNDRIAIGVLWRLSPANYMDGYLAEVGVWDATLTDAEAAILATGVSPLAVRPQSLVAYWPLFGNLSPEIDLVGGYDMTLNNAPTQADHPPSLHLPSADLSYQAPAAGYTLLEFDPRSGRPEQV